MTNIFNNHPYATAIVTDLTIVDQINAAYQFIIYDLPKDPRFKDLDHNDILDFILQQDLGATNTEYIINQRLYQLMDNVMDIQKDQHAKIDINSTYNLTFKEQAGYLEPTTGNFARKTIKKIDTVMRQANQPIGPEYNKRYPTIKSFKQDILKHAPTLIRSNFYKNNMLKDDEQLLDVFDFINQKLNKLNSPYKLAFVTFYDPNMSIDNHVLLVYEKDKEDAIRQFANNELIPYLQQRNYETFFIFKPDAIEKNLTIKLIKLAKQNGLTLQELKRIKASKQTLDTHYYHIKDEPFYQNVVKYMTRGDIYIGIFSGFNAIHKWRELLGQTDPGKADKDSIRGKYGNAKTMENIAHGSDSVENAKREIRIWFGYNHK